MEQQYILRNAKSFEPVHIFECGQCFRWNKEEDGSYTGVIKNGVINVKKIGNDVNFTGVCDENIKQICEEYFNLQTNYEAIKEKLSNIDIYLKNSIEYGNGIRILKQDLWETLLSFIISANNNIPRIKTIIERIAKKYGNRIEYRNKMYYTFPTPEMLQNASIDDFRGLGLGFRDVRIYETVQRTLKGEIDLEKLKQEENTEVLRKKLLEIPGVGPKVADCVMLFALNRFDVFPVDVWVKRVISELYFNKKEQTPNVIHEFAEKQYGNLAGLAQQYLFYWRRENSI
jgi:N-glycosylase/DNA lyase